MPVLDLIVVVVFAVTLALVARAVRGVVVEAISQAVDVGAFNISLFCRNKTKKVPEKFC